MARLGSLLALGALLVPAEAALAVAGGGSSGFGGGGGGSSGGGFSGSGGSGEGDPVVGFTVIGIFVLLVLFFAVSAIRFAKKRRRREARVRLAAAEAAQDDPAFAPDAVAGSASELFLAAQRAWDARDREQLRRLTGDDLFVEWERRLADFDSKGWHNRVRVHEPPEVKYVGLVNREADAEDRVVVQISAKLDDYVEDASGATVHRNGSNSKVTSLNEYWTLAKRDGRWIVTSIEQFGEGLHHLDSEIVATPWDDSRLADEAVVEIAVGDGLPPGYTPADVADLDFDGDARTAALDLSLADPRFAPDVLEAAARGAVEAWAEAVDGADAPLEAAATPEAVRDLLYAGDPSATTRLVVRGPRVRQIRIAALDAGAQPATMTVDVHLGGVRYVENRDTAAVVSGSRDAATTFSERWTLALDGSPERPWRIASVAAELAAG